MGTIIEFHKVADEEAMLSRLLVYMKAIQKMLEPKSVSKELAEGLLACKPNRRSMKLEQIFNAVLGKYPDGVMIKDIDVMFNPDYTELEHLNILFPFQCEVKKELLMQSDKYTMSGFGGEVAFSLKQ